MAEQYLLENVRSYKDPNPALTAILLEGRLAVYLGQVAGKVKDLYQARVAKRSGRLADSAHVQIERGGVRNDRWTAKVVVGGDYVRNPKDGFTYAALHEFGSPKNRTEFPPAHDLKSIVEELSQ